MRPSQFRLEILLVKSGSRPIFTDAIYMKQFAVFKASVAVFLLLSAAPVARSQFLDSSVGLGAGLIRLFGATTAFSAQADVQVLDTNRQEVLRTPMNFALLDGKVRMEFEMTQMRGKAVQPAVVNAMKQISLNQVASVLRLDKRIIHVLFPGVRSYVDTELSAEETAAAEKNVQVQRTALGKETIDNHPCTKNRVQVKNAKGVLLMNATTWNATDMKDFPLQISVQAKDGITTMRFKQVKLTRPAAALFEPPAGFTKYGNPDMLLLAAAQKQMTGGSKANAPLATTPAKATPVSPAKPAVQKKAVTNVKPPAAASRVATPAARTNAATVRPSPAPKPQPATRK